MSMAAMWWCIPSDVGGGSGSAATIASSLHRSLRDHLRDAGRHLLQVIQQLVRALSCAKVFFYILLHRVIMHKRDNRVDRYGRYVRWVRHTFYQTKVPKMCKISLEIRWFFAYINAKRLI